MTTKHWQDRISALLGGWVFVSPGFLLHAIAATGRTGGAATWNLSLAGALVVVFALGALARFVTWKEWCLAALGIWLVASPWFWVTEASVALTWSAVISGFLIIVLAASSLGEAHDRFPRRVLPKGDMREGLPELALPDEHEHIAGEVMNIGTGPWIVAPDQQVQAPGETTKG